MSRSSGSSDCSDGACYAPPQSELIRGQHALQRRRQLAGRAVQCGDVSDEMTQAHQRDFGLHVGHGTRAALPNGLEQGQDDHLTGLLHDGAVALGLDAGVERHGHGPEEDLLV